MKKDSVATRQPFEGVLNIIRFNWPFFLLATILVVLIFMPGQLILPQPLGSIVALALLMALVLPLLASWYVYDLSGLYGLRWLDTIITANNPVIWNIHAGFDETSELLKQKFHPSRLFVFDFYNPDHHTEKSIKRARKWKQPYAGTVSISTSAAQFSAPKANAILLLFAAHEIRDHKERVSFLQQLARHLEKDGSLLILEHYRDLPNFIAYNIGFFHFLSQQEWLKTFSESGLRVVDSRKINPFVNLLTIKAIEHSS